MLIELLFLEMMIALYSIFVFANRSTDNIGDLLPLRSVPKHWGVVKYSLLRRF